MTYALADVYRPRIWAVEDVAIVGTRAVMCGDQRLTSYPMKGKVSP